jgi:hypothetical protein
MARQIQQHQVPDGMVANVPWGWPLDEWTDRMIERGLRHLDESDGARFFPFLTARMAEQANGRGIAIAKGS